MHSEGPLWFVSGGALRIQAPILTPIMPYIKTPIALAISLAFLCVAQCIAATDSTIPRPAFKPVQAADAKKTVPDSRQLEKDLQSLNWKQFKSVVEAIPPIRAEVDRYGLVGWEYVQQHYKTYPWRKPIAQLEAWQKAELARLIDRARKSS